MTAVEERAHKGVSVYEATDHRGEGAKPRAARKAGGRGVTELTARQHLQSEVS